MIGSKFESIGRRKPARIVHSLLPVTTGQGTLCSLAFPDDCDPALSDEAIHCSVLLLRGGLAAAVAAILLNSLHRDLLCLSRAETLGLLLRGRHLGLASQCAALLRREDLLRSEKRARRRGSGQRALEADRGSVRNARDLRLRCARREARVAERVELVAHLVKDRRDEIMLLLQLGINLRDGNILARRTRSLDREFVGVDLSKRALGGCVLYVEKARR